MWLLIILLTLLAFCLGGMALGCYRLYRNDKVYKFRYEILDLESERHSEAIRQGLFFKRLNLLDKYSYDDMLYSFKPLKLENWFTEEEIEYLTIPRER